MVLKIKRGFTLVEISVAIALLAVLFIVIVLIINPTEYKQKSLDTKRVLHISKLYEAITEHKLKNGVYPGDKNKLYVSTVSHSTSLTNPSYGWIEADLSEFLQIQPIDPVNTEPHVYKYIHTETDFELNAVLQNNINAMVNDKGNNNLIFEMGTDLELLN